MRSFTLLKSTVLASVLLGLAVPSQAQPFDVFSVEVPLDIIIFADDDGSNQAVTSQFVEDVIDRMNEVQYNPHQIEVYARTYTILNSTTHNNHDEGVGGAKKYADDNTLGTANRDSWIVASFFTVADYGGGIAWGGGGNKNTINTSDSTRNEFFPGFPSETEEEWVNRVATIMAHEVGHSLGLRHLADYEPGSGFHSDDPGNEDNRMNGGTYFTEWQADIMRNTQYAYPIPEPTTGLFFLGGASVLLMRRRRSAGVEA